MLSFELNEIGLLKFCRFLEFIPKKKYSSGFLRAGKMAKEYDQDICIYQIVLYDYYDFALVGPNFEQINKQTREAKKKNNKQVYVWEVHLMILLIFCDLMRLVFSFFSSHFYEENRNQILIRY